LHIDNTVYCMGLSTIDGYILTINGALSQLRGYMNTIFKRTLLTSSVLMAVFLPQAYATNGMVSHGYGALQKAMGGAAVAGSDNAMNMATNPASLSFGEDNWTAGVEAFVPDRGATVGTARDGNETKVFGVPEFAYQKKLSDKFAAGLAVYGNGGMNSDYTSVIYSADGTTKTGIDLSQLVIAPSASMKIGKNSSVGISLNMAYQRFKATGMSAFSGSTTSGTNDNLSDQGYDSSTGLGVTLGWQGRLSDKVMAGFSYKSKTDMSKLDKYSELFAEQGNLDIPSMITAGFSIQATPKTTFAIDVTRINYTDVKAISNPNNTSGIPTGGPRLGDNEGAGFGWSDQNVLKIGMKHQMSEKLALLAGFNHGKAPIGSDQTAFNVVAPATVETHVTLGVDWKLAKNSGVTVQYMHAFENEIKGDGVSPGSFADQVGTVADINMSQDALGVSYTRKF
jgi:long-chain fatty acid transport protein